MEIIDPQQSGIALRGPCSPRGYATRCAVSSAPSAVVWPAPVEREVLARLAAALPAEVERVGPIGCGRAPGRDLTGTDLRARSVMHLDASSGRARGPRQRLRLAEKLARDLDAPGPQVLVDLEVDVGGWANVHGQGIAHLQRSNQSPETRQPGKAAMSGPFIRDSRLKLRSSL